MNKYKLLLVLCIVAINAFSTIYYVSTTGSDDNNGTLNSAFATLNRAQKAVSAGDTVYVRGGVYKINSENAFTNQKIWAVVHLMNKSGKAGKYIHYFAFPGEKPVLDFSDFKPKGLRIMAFNVTGSWLHFKGLDITGVQVTLTGHTQSECIHNEGSNNIFENLRMYEGQAIGFYLTKGSNNLVLNCDAFRNYDFVSEGGKGGNVDGFGCHPQPGSKGNIFRGCRAWFNSDDGYDCIRASETVVFENCWAFFNGFSPDFKKLGDGNGFKAGGWGLNKDRRVPDSIPGHVIRFCLAVKNRANGFYSNHHLVGSQWINNTAYRNSSNYNMLNRTVDFTQDIPGEGHQLINNLSYDHKLYDIEKIDTAKCELRNNSFQLGLNIKRDDFVTLDLKLLEKPRNADGSLPVTGLLMPSEKSCFVDKGVDVGYPFKGKAPDLGCFER